MPMSGTAGSYGNCILVSWANSVLFSIGATQTYIPTNSVGGFPFLHTLSSICYLWTFYDGQFGQWEVELHCSFDLHFPSN